MNNVTGNCTDTQAGITVKAAFDRKQSGQQAFMKLIRKQYYINGADTQNNDIDKTTYNISRTQSKGYTINSGTAVSGTTVGFAENGRQYNRF